MSKVKKVYIASIVAWLINLKLFLALANHKEVAQIYSLSESTTSFIKNILLFYNDFFSSIGWFTLILSTIFAVTLLYFWISYFKVYFYKLPAVTTGKAGILGIFGSILTFIGFGCVACGQTLITSVLLFLVGTGSAFLAYSVGNISIIIGTIILVLAIRRNNKMYNDKNICKI